MLYQSVCYIKVLHKVNKKSGFNPGDGVIQLTKGSCIALISLFTGTFFPSICLTLNMPGVENYTFMPGGGELDPPPKISARSGPIFKKLGSLVL